MQLTDFSTPQLELAVSTQADLPELIRLRSETFEYFSFDPPPGPGETPETEARATLLGQRLPPGGVAGQHTHLSIRQGGRMVGFAAVYLGYPGPQVAYLSIFFLEAALRGGGLGAEAVTGLKARLAALGFAQLRVGVSLRNWPALRFWARQGFTTVTKVSAQGDIAPEKFGSIELAAELTTTPH